MAIKIVKTECGMVEGLPAEDQAISVFKGIPYAKQPVGQGRWKLPEACPPWEGVFKAYAFGPMALQPPIKEGSFYAKEFYPDLELPREEGGLYVNVWTPARTGDEKLPVAVWIHGGGFTNGYSHKMEYNGTEFAKRGIVFCSINYRLNIFGFFAHPELTKESSYGGSGLYGHYDQRAGLEWIKRNVEGFGGDPNTITILGQSAGGSSVLAQCVTPLNPKGLFQRAVMQSNAGLVDHGFWLPLQLAEAEQIGVDFFEFMGFRNLEEARAYPAWDLMTKWFEFCGKRGIMAAVRNVDNNFFPKTDKELLLEGNFADVDYLIGCNKDEHLGFTKKTETFENLRKELKVILEDDAELFEEHIPLESEEQAAFISNHLWGGEMLAFGDAFCELLLKLGRKPGYRYWFTRIPPGEDHPGVFHSAEYLMVYKTLRFSWRPYTGADYEFSDMFNRYWSNFIKTGNPNGKNLYGEDMPLWTPYTKDAPYALALDADAKMCVPGYPSDREIVEHVKKINTLT